MGEVDGISSRVYLVLNCEALSVHEIQISGMLKTTWQTVCFVADSQLMG